MSRPIRAYIHREAMAANLRLARGAAPGARIWAVVKADGYGHGLIRAAQALRDADGFALLEFDRAIQLRSAFPDHRILMLEGPFDESDVEKSVQHGFDLLIHEAQQIDWICRIMADRSDASLRIHLKFDSGMARLGFDFPGLLAARERASAIQGVQLVGLATHFANADQSGGVEGPLARFLAASDGFSLERSMANSAALLAVPATHADWVRPGIMLYGGSPFEQRNAAELGLQPAMSLKSALIAVRSIDAGAPVGYGSCFRADQAMRIGTVACGYADGYPRHAPTGTPILVGGVRTRVIGRVSMDMISVDLERVAHAQVGTEVELWGRELPVDEVAAAAGTIGYELMCALAPRVPVIEQD